MKPKQTLVDVGLEIHANGFHISDNLLGRLFKGKVQAPLAVEAGPVGEAPGQTGLARAGGTRYQDTAALEKTFTIQHLVEARNAGRNPLARYRMRKPERGDGQYRNPILINQKRIFIGTMHRTPVLDYS